MQQFISMAKALSDESRVRIVMALRHGELCLCQIVDMLELAPATVSKHMTLLYQAGLIQRRKEGRWHYFRLTDKEGTVAARQALRWVKNTLERNPIVESDNRKLQRIRCKDVKLLTACYVR